MEEPLHAHEIDDQYCHWNEIHSSSFHCFLWRSPGSILVEGLDEISRGQVPSPYLYFFQNPVGLTPQSCEWW